MERRAVKQLLASGRASVQSGYPLSDFINYTRTPSGEVLTQEIDVGYGVLISRGPADLITPLLARGLAVFGARAREIPRSRAIPSPIAAP